MSRGDLGQHVGLGVSKVIRSLVGTVSASLWQEFTSVRGTDKLTAFRENRLGLRGSGEHVLADAPLPKAEVDEARAYSTGLPRKMHLSFKKGKMARVSAAGTAGNSSWNCGSRLGWIRARRESSSCGSQDLPAGTHTVASSC